MSLRTGLVPISELKSAGYEVLVGRHAISEQASQAFLAGDGVKHAEIWVKDVEKGKEYDVGDTGRVEDVDCSGFECRWEPIKTTKGVIVSLIVEAIGATGVARNGSYRAVISEVEAVMGGLDLASPAHRNSLNLSQSEPVSK